MQNILSALLARLAQEVVHLLKLAMMALPVDIIRIIMIIDIAVCPSPLHPNVIKIILGTACVQKVFHSALNNNVTDSVTINIVIRLQVDGGLNTGVTVHSWRRCPARTEGDIRPEAILSTSFGSSGTARHRQVACTCQIWISGWILPHFDVRTISVASKLKKLQTFCIKNI